MKDDRFVRGKVPMTKMEIRSCIISYLELENASNCLDIGAGTGSVSVEMAKLYPALEVHAIERAEEGCNLIRENATRHDVKVNIWMGEAPITIQNFNQKFDRVYLGGTGGSPEDILRWLEEHHLKDNAVLVFSFITLDNLMKVLNYLEVNNKNYHSVEGSHIQASRLDFLGEYKYFKPQNSCYVIKCVYGGKCE